MRRTGRKRRHLVEAATGKEVWQLAFAESVGDEWGPGPRSTPIMDGDRVYIQSCTGEFRCVNLADGKVIWGTSFERDFGVRFLGSKQNDGIAARRGNNGCGVVEGERLIVPVGGAHGASLVCFNKFDGKKLWASQNDEAAYSATMVATLAGVRQVVAFTADALLGLELETGKLLWRAPLVTDAKRHAATPIINGDTVTVNSHTFGLICFQISKTEGGLKAAQLWVNRDLKINVATPVLAGRYLYSVGVNKDYVCVDATTGKVMWKHAGFGEVADSAIVVGDKLLVQSDNGILRLVATDPTQYTELGQAQVCGKTWSHPAYTDGKLWVREGLDRGYRLTCFDLLAR